MKIRFQILVIFLSLFFFNSCQNQNIAQKVTKPPNIILFLVDDMGWQDTSVPFWTSSTKFNKIYRTPNLEKLAMGGMKFTQAYATPVCSPTRVSLMTGMNAARHRVTNWTLRKDKMHNMETQHKILEIPFWNVNGMTNDSTVNHAVYASPFPQILKDAGYFTVHTGKAHLGAIGTPGEDPQNIGFEVNIAGHAAGAPKSYLGTENFGNIDKYHNTPWPVPGLEQYYGKDIFLTEALTLEAMKTLEDPIHKKKPFFLYMSYYGVHTPITADDRFFQTYIDNGLDTIEARYASMLAAMDKSVGDILNFVDEKNIADNTIILFMSDNGGLSAVARGGEKHTHNKPLSSGKGSIHEGGIREPMFVRWPGKVKANSVNHNYLIIEDFFPSILEMAGVENYKTVQKIDGISFVSSLLDDTAEAANDRSLFWHYPNEWGPTGPGINAFSAIRKGDWKLIYYYHDQSFELFNIKDDIGESKNLAASNTGKLAALAKILTDYLIEVNAQIPALKSTGKTIPLPADYLAKG